MIKALENLSDRITVNYEGEPCYDIVFSKDFSEIGNELKKFNIENETVIITIGNNNLNVLATAGGTCSGILISNLLDFDKTDISSPTTNPTIIATNNPCAPINFVVK